MPTAHVARLIANRELVGFFAGDNLVDLFWSIDECCDPNAVEITALGAGGIYWSQKTLRLPLAEGHLGEGMESPDLNTAELTEEWREPLYREDGRTWRSLREMLDERKIDPYA